MDLSKEGLLSWLAASAQTPHWSRWVLPLRKRRVDELYQLMSPRNIFMKNLPPGSTLLDLGAGEGSACGLRQWPRLNRKGDLRLLGTSLQSAKNLSLYDEVVIGDFEVAFREFSSRPIDAILCCHFIEHLHDQHRALVWMKQILRGGGSLFLEWPHPVSLTLPSRFELNSFGHNLMTVNFHDVPTHVYAAPMNEIQADLENLGFEIESAGRIRFPFLAEQLRDIGRKTGDAVNSTFGIWAHVGWAQYIVANKV